MKKFLVMALFSLAGLAAFAGTCVITRISLVQTDGSHDTFAGQLDNTSGVNILQHNFIVAFLDSSNNVVETKIVSGCLRSVQNNATDFFSATSTSSSSVTSTGLARIAFDSTFRVGTTSSQNTSITNIGASRSTTTLTVSGKVTNNAGSTLISPNVCVVVRDSSGNVLITTTLNLSDISAAANRTFSGTVTVPNDSSANSVDIWVDGLDSSNNPTTPDRVTGTTVGTGTPTPVAGNKLSFSTQPVGGVGITTNFGTMPVVKVLDSSSNLVSTGTGSTASITLAVKAGTAPAGTVLTCTNNTVAAVAGIATFAGCQLNHAASGIVLTATSSGLTSADSSGIAINPSAATGLTFTTAPAGAAGGTAFATQPAVAVTDLNGDTVWNGASSTLAITLAIGTNPSTGTLSGCTANPFTAVAGVATFVGCKIDKSGAGYTLTAAAPGPLTGLSGGFTVAVGAAAKLKINQPAAGTSPYTLAPQPVVTVQDAGGNTVTSSTASIALTVQQIALGPTTLACTQVANTMPAALGIATFSGCVLTTAGTVTITAASTGLTPAVTTNVVVS